MNHGDAFSMAREGRLYWWAPMPNDVPEIAMIMADEHVSRYRTDQKMHIIIRSLIETYNFVIIIVYILVMISIHAEIRRPESARRIRHHHDDRTSGR